MEIEAKLLVPDPVTADRIREETAWAGDYALLPGRSIDVVDTYLDTNAKTLRKAGYACRRRSTEGVLIMTLKGLGAGSGGIHRREEIEQTVPFDSPPSQWPPGPVREKLLPLIGGQPLHVLFDLRQERFVREVVFAQRRVASASLDRVHVSGAGGEKEWQELEIELLPEGTEHDLEALVDWLQSTYGLHPSPVSKFEAALAATQAAPRPRASSRRAEARVRVRELEPPRTLTEEHLVSTLSAMGYRPRPPVRRTERLLFYDTIDGVAARKGLTLRYSLTDDEWRLCRAEEPKAVARGSAGSSSVIADAGALLPPESSPGSWIAFMAAELQEADYRLKSSSGSSLGLRVRLWKLESAREPSVTGTMMDLAVSGVGSSTDLGYLLSLLSTRLECRPAATSVLTRGLAILSLPAPGAPTPDEFRTRPADTVSLARHRILAGEAWRLEQCLPGVVEDLDSEYVHQMRVATRRARFASRLFDGGDAEDARRLRTELGWLAALLGAVRDKDVFMERCRGMYAAIGADAGIQSLLEQRLSSARAKSQATLREALGSERARDLLVRLKDSPPADRVSLMDASPLPSFALRCCTRVFDKVARWGRRPVTELSDAELHELRILFKRARYTCDFFGTVLGKEVVALARAIVPYQDCLGSFQDATAALAFLDRLATEWAAEHPSGAVLVALGGLMQIQRHTQTLERDRFEQLWASVEGLVGRWRKARHTMGERR